MNKIWKVYSGARGKDLAAYPTKRLAQQHVKKVEKVHGEDYELHIIPIEVQPRVKSDIEELLTDWT